MTDSPKLTRSQRNVLAGVLSFFEKNSGAPPTASELAEYLPGGRPTYAVRDRLAALERKGLVERLGKSEHNANCFGVTDAGRAALAQQEGRENG